MADNKQECCGTCRFHRHDRGADDWVCICPESDGYGDYTGYDGRCAEWEARQ